MKKNIKVLALAAVALSATGCMNGKATDGGDLASLKASIEEARTAAMNAERNSQAAYELSKQNADKINRVFRKSQLK